VVHPRVDFAKVLEDLPLKTSAAPLVPFIADEALMKKLPDTARLPLLSAEKFVPTTLRDHCTRLDIQATERITIMNAAVAAGMIAAGEGAAAPAASRPAVTADIKIPLRVLGPIFTTKGSVKSSTITRNAVILSILSRGLIEYSNWANYIAWRKEGGFKGIRAHTFLQELHTSLLPDLAVVKTALENPDTLVAPLAPVLDGNVFFILGAYAASAEQGKIHLPPFFRAERGRLENIAKKNGWKPMAFTSSAGAAGAGTTSPADAADSDEEPLPSARASLLGKRPPPSSPPARPSQERGDDTPTPQPNRKQRRWGGGGRGGGGQGRGQGGGPNPAGAKVDPKKKVK
jgi:hypothetical protein